MTYKKKMIISFLGIVLATALAALATVWIERPIPEVAISSIRTSLPEDSKILTISDEIQELSRKSHWISSFGDKEEAALVHKEFQELRSQFLEHSSEALEILRSVKEKIKRSGQIDEEEKNELAAQLFRSPLIINTIRGEIDRFELKLDDKSYGGHKKIVRVTQVKQLGGSARFVVEFSSFIAEALVVRRGADQFDLQRLNRYTPFFMAIRYFDDVVLLSVLDHAEKSILTEMEIASKLNDGLEAVFDELEVFEITLTIVNSGKRAMTISPFSALQVYAPRNRYDPILLSYTSETDGTNTNSVPKYITVGGDESVEMVFLSEAADPDLNELLKTGALACQVVVENIQASPFSSRYYKSEMRTFGDEAKQSFADGLFSQF